MGPSPGSATTSFATMISGASLMRLTGQNQNHAKLNKFLFETRTPAPNNEILLVGTLSSGEVPAGYSIKNSNNNNPKIVSARWTIAGAHRKNVLSPSHRPLRAHKGASSGVHNYFLFYAFLWITDKANVSR